MWILLLSVVALRSGALPKLLGWFGAIIGVAGLASVVPPLHDAAIVFGLALIAWFIWVGVVLLKTKATEAMADQPSGTATGQAWAPSNKRFQRAAEAVR
jgi:hypothetical protein